MFSYLQQPKGFYKRLFLLALPVIVQNLITTSLGFLDTFMVGLLGSEQMSAVTVANVPVFIIQLVVFGLQSGSSVLISQYWGRGDRESINRVMGIGFMIAGGVSVLFAAILCAFPAQVLYLITDNLTLVELAEPYLRIVGFSYIFNSLSSIYIGMQRSTENPAMGMIVFGISMLAGCTPNNAAVGDTQSAGDAVAHSMKDRNSLDVAMIGSQDEQTDRLALDAMEAGGLRPVYLPVAGTVDMQDTARQAVEDMTQRMVSIIVISGIDVSGVNHDGWYDTLTTARQAGIPVALLNPIATPTDSTLFAATLTINDHMTDATPLADAVAGIANNDPHDRTILVTTISHGGKQ